MIPCPLCQSPVPEVVGAPTQVCPTCGAEVPVATPAAPAPVRTDAGKAIGRAVRAVLDDYPAWLALYLPLALVALVAELGFLFATDAIGYDGTAPTDPAAFALLVILAVPFGLVQWGVGAAFVGVGAAVTASAVAEGRRVRPRDGLRLLRARGLPLVGAGVVFVAVLIAGLFLAIVPMFFFLHWYLWTTAYVAEGDAPGEAFRKSRDLARRPGMKATTLVVVLAWLAVALARYAGGSLLAPWLGGGDLGSTLGGALVGLPLLPFVPALVGACLVAARASAAPAPRAEVACPGCAKPIAYAPTGTPQRVVCANCGRAGTVR